MNKQKIFVGITNYDELYFLNISPPYQNETYFSMNSDTYKLVEEEQGEDEARERLEDGELWRLAVEQGQTTHSLSDWVDQVLSIDGWESQFDFDNEISPITHKNKTFYLDFSSGGQHRVPVKDIQYFAIPQSAYVELLRIWTANHLKPNTPNIPAINQDINTEIQKAMEYLDNNYLLHI